MRVSDDRGRDAEVRWDHFLSFFDRSVPLPVRVAMIPGVGEITFRFNWKSLIAAIIAAGVFWLLLHLNLTAGLWQHVSLFAFVAVVVSLARAFIEFPPRVPRNVITYCRRLGFCTVCLAHLGGEDSSDDGCTVCPICEAAWRFDQHVRMMRHDCQRCGYDLRGLEAGRNGRTVCPECGAIWRLGEVPAREGVSARRADVPRVDKAGGEHAG